ncbi:MAG TPA: phage tail sheath subtilisin-like domain-containing protein [Pyrinomonadaceae bacterium]|nr:phage tail sheath subtilisin-like domain-containing protein [Pyrinomonadaceae bacterium]
MSANYKTPGVYRSEIFLRPEEPFQTGVPAFVGFADVVPAAGQTPSRQPVMLFRKEEFAAKFKTPQDAYLAEAVRGFFSNGGTRCYIVPVDATATDREAALLAALETLAPLTDFDLVAVPDAMMLYTPTQQTQSAFDAVLRVQRGVIMHCAAHNDRMALLDSLPARTTETVLTQRASLVTGLPDASNAAFYYPWIQVFDADLNERDPKTRGLRYVPPSGHVAGIYARTDRSVGVYKAPANAEVLGAIDLEIAVDNQTQEQLNPQGVNCLRAFAGRGLRVWGARTLARDNFWRYVNVRRQFLTVNRWIALFMTWSSFEPNAARLWVRIERELTAYLETLWRSGALKGEVREDAFYVKCDEETNPPEVRDTGEVVTEVGLALVAPAEFVVVRIFHRAGTTLVG